MLKGDETMTTKITAGARLFLGLIYFVFGLNGFLHFLKMTPPPMSETAMAYAGGLAKSGYFMPLLSGTQAIGGFFLLIGFASPLALIVLAPVTLNIILFHAFLTPGLQNLGLPIVMTVLQIIAMSGYGKIYRTLFSKR